MIMPTRIPGRGFSDVIKIKEVAGGLQHRFLWSVDYPTAWGCRGNLAPCHPNPCCRSGHQLGCTLGTWHDWWMNQHAITATAVKGAQNA